MADDNASRNADFIGRVVNDAKNPPETRLLSGWFGDSGESDTRRLYTNAELSSYVDIPTDAILYSEPIRDAQPAGAVLVWVKADASLKQGGSAFSRAARFLKGQVAQDFSTPEKAGFQCATQFRCEPTGFTGECTKQPQVGGAWPCITAIPHCAEPTGFTGECTHQPWPLPTRYFGCTIFHCPTHDLTHIPQICNMVATGLPGCGGFNPPPEGGDPAVKERAAQFPTTALPGCGYTKTWGLCETHLLGCPNTKACPPTHLPGCGWTHQPLLCHHTAATVCTQAGCPTYPNGDCTFFGCPHTPATVCTQAGCPTFPNGDCTFFGCWQGAAAGGAQQQQTTPMCASPICATNIACPTLPPFCPQVTPVCPPTLQCPQAQRAAAAQVTPPTFPSEFPLCHTVPPTKLETCTHIGPHCPTGGTVCTQVGANCPTACGPDCQSQQVNCTQMGEVCLTHPIECTQSGPKCPTNFGPPCPPVTATGPIVACCFAPNVQVADRVAGPQPTIWTQIGPQCPAPGGGTYFTFFWGCGGTHFPCYHFTLPVLCDR